MALEKYKAKRRFDVTPEPKATVAKSGKGHIFVVQEHDASRHHYDFRLEAGGVLKSWAVPKEPAMDPKIKRLAVQVEDHPLEYAKFHGDIPEGEYGAGHVEIWDKGTYANLMEKKASPLSMQESLDAGHVEVELHGRKLKGAFALVRTQIRKGKGKENWLLIKMKDRFAKEDSGSGVQGSAKKEGKAEQVTWTHFDKVMFPEKGFTKGDVLEFYKDIAPVLLPYLKDRPITVERLPDGMKVGGPRFWQKNTPEYYPKWIERVELAEQGGRKVQYAVINDVQSLLYMVNQGALTFHTYFSRVGSLDRPDFVLFDLDPGGAEFGDVVKIAKRLHGVLEEEKVESLVKTSGKTGLHVVTKCPGGCSSYEKVRTWALEIAERLVDDISEIATLERSKAARRGRVYVDVEQNALGKHAVPPYVLRAVAEATVSMPLEWGEVNSRLDPAKFDIRSALKRVKSRGDMWKGLL